jgi:hypothetical protein
MLLKENKIYARFQDVYENKALAENLTAIAVCGEPSMWIRV